MTINVCASFLCLCPLLCLFVCVMHTLLLELSACIHSVVLFVRALYHHEHYNSIKVNLFTVILADRNFLACSYTYLTPHTHPHTHPSHTPHTPPHTTHHPPHTLTHTPHTPSIYTGPFLLSVSVHCGRVCGDHAHCWNCATAPSKEGTLLLSKTGKLPLLYKEDARRLTSLDESTYHFYT